MFLLLRLPDLSRLWWQFHRDFGRTPPEDEAQPAGSCATDMGSCQNYGPYWGTLENRCRIIIRTPKGTIILTTTHIDVQRVCLHTADMDISKIYRSEELFWGPGALGPTTAMVTILISPAKRLLRS